MFHMIIEFDIQSKLRGVATAVAKIAGPYYYLYRHEI